MTNGEFVHKYAASYPYDQSGLLGGVGSFCSQATSTSNSSIASVTYLSPGVGFGQSLASVGDTAFFRGSGIIDSLVVSAAWLSGVKLQSTGAKGHNALGELNSPPVQQRLNALNPLGGQQYCGVSPPSSLPSSGYSPGGSRTGGGLIFQVFYGEEGNVIGGAWVWAGPLPWRPPSPL